MARSLYNPNKIVYSRMFTFSIPDLTKREFTVLLLLEVSTVLFDIYPAAILDAVHYTVYTLIYSLGFSLISSDAPKVWGIYFQNSASLDTVNLIVSKIIYYLVIMYVLLLGFLDLLSTNNSPLYKKLLALQARSNTQSRCNHSIIQRRHLGVMKIISFIRMLDVAAVDLLFKTH